MQRSFVLFFILSASRRLVCFSRQPVHTHAVERRHNIPSCMLLSELTSFCCASLRSEASCNLAADSLCFFSFCLRFLSCLFLRARACRNAWYRYVERLQPGYHHHCHHHHQLTSQVIITFITSLHSPLKRAIMINQ